MRRMRESAISTAGSAVLQRAWERSAGIAGGALERVHRFRLRGLPRGGEAEHDSGNGGDGGGDGKDAPVHRNLLDARDVGGREIDEQAHQSQAEQDAGATSGDGNEQAFGQELAHDPHLAGAEGEPHSGFMAPGDGAHQKQVGHVDAGDQHDQRGGAEDGDEGVAHAAHQVAVERRDGRGDAGVGIGILLFERGGNGLKLGARCFDCRARGEARHDVHFMVAVALKKQRREERGSVDLDAVLAAELGGGFEAGGQDADDAVRFSVEADEAIEDAGVGTEAALPELVGDDDDGGRAGAVLRGEEIAAEGGGDAKHGEEGRGDGFAVEPDGVAQVRQVHGGAVVGRESGEGGGGLFVIEKVGHRNGGAFLSAGAAA